MRRKNRIHKTREAALKHKKETRRHTRNLETLRTRLSGVKTRYRALLAEGKINTALAFHRTSKPWIIEGMIDACTRIRTKLALCK